MFSIKKITEEGFDKIILQDNDSGTFAAVVPACGAILHSFSVVHNGRMVNVIDSYESAADFRSNVTAKGFKGTKLSPFACRMKNATYHFGQEQYHIKKFLLGDSALHGLLYDAIFTVESTSADESTATVILKYAYRSADEGYPFDYVCMIGYTLEKDNRLFIVTTIINKSGGLLPLQDGWHPYFTMGGSIDNLQLEFQSKEVIAFDDALIPTGQLSDYQEFSSLKKIGNHIFDHCFTVNFAECQPMCVIRDAAQRLQVEIHPGKSYPYLQVYTAPHRNSIAIENLSAAPDAFNNGMGLISLAAKETAEFRTMYKISALP